MEENLEIYQRAQNILIQDALQKFLRRKIKKSDLNKIELRDAPGTLFILVFNKVLVGHVDMTEDLTTMLFYPNPSVFPSYVR